MVILHVYIRALCVCVVGVGVDTWSALAPADQI